MAKIEVGIWVTVSGVDAGYEFDDIVRKEVSIQGYYPALATLRFEPLCHSLAQGALREYVDNLELKREAKDE